MSEAAPIPLLITTPTNIRYLTGFVGASPEEREVYVLLTPDQMYLFTNALYIEQAKKLSKALRVIEISRENPLSKELALLCTKLHIKEIGFEDVNLTVAELTKLTQVMEGITLKPMRSTIEKKREIKKPAEIEFIRKASKITDECFSYILPKLKPGVTEAEIAWEMQTFFRKNDAEDAFSPIVAFGKNSSQPHYSSLSNGAKENQSLALKSGDIILLDFGAKVNGYCADMTRVVFLGKPKDEWMKAYNCVLDAQQSALQYLKDCYHVPLHDSKNGIDNSMCSGAQADRIARQVLAKEGFPPYPHSLGHALGLDIHESPRLSRTQDSLLKPNMVITIEPGVYIENSYGFRIEDTVLISHDTIEVLTQSPKEITVL